MVAEYLKKVGYEEEVKRAMPIQLKSPNAIAPVDTYTAFSADGAQMAKERF